MLSIIQVLLILFNNSIIQSFNYQQLTKDTRDELGLTHASKCVAIDDGYVFCRDRSKAIGKKDVEKLIEFKDAITIKEPDASIYLACERMLI